jgi:translation initiation factor IF-3
LIDENGNQMGIMSSYDARNVAYDRGLDLVKINSDSRPVVCKLMNLSKFKYEQKKKDKLSKKNQKNIIVKEIRISLSIDIHDINIKIDKAREFIKNGDKVKLSLRFRGRELSHANKAYSVIDKFIEALGDVAIIEKRPIFENRSIFVVISPKI